MANANKMIIWAQTLCRKIHITNISEPTDFVRYLRNRVSASNAFEPPPPPPDLRRLSSIAIETFFKIKTQYGVDFIASLKTMGSGKGRVSMRAHKHVTCTLVQHWPMKLAPPPPPHRMGLP